MTTLLLEFGPEQGELATPMLLLGLYSRKVTDRIDFQIAYNGFNGVRPKHGSDLLLAHQPSRALRSAGSSPCEIQPE